jgi:hypothetical protein
LLSFVLLAVSLYIRVQMRESPLFARLEREGKTSQNPFFGNPLGLAKADPAQVNVTMLVVLIAIQMVYVCMVYGPIAAFLVELFPTRIRYSSMFLPYHLGNGWFGGFLPLIAAAVTASEWAKESFGSGAISIDIHLHRDAHRGRPLHR